MIEVREIDIEISGAPLLRKVSLEVRPGEVLAVLGPNGAGKSTLLKAVAGELRIAAGEVRLESRPLKDWSWTDLARRRSVLSQQVRIPFGLTVHETVALGRFPYRNEESPRQSGRIAARLIRQEGLLPFLHRMTVTLSGGEQQRVHFTRALAQLHAPAVTAPRYLLLDEPTASLDIAQQHRLLSRTRQLAHADGWGVLTILHDINLAAQYADRILLLHRGRAVAWGSPAEVLTPARIKRTFGLEATVDHHPQLRTLQVRTYC